MKRGVLVFLCLVAAAAQAATTPNATPSPATPAASPAKLYWNNGEKITGEIVDASPAGLTWKTPLFEDPLVLAWPALRGIEQTVAALPSADPFLFLLRDGSSIFGDLVSVTDKEVAIHSSRHGNVALKRSEVLSMRRLKGETLLFHGPVGDAGWTSTATSPLAVKPGGVLSIPYWNRAAALDIKFPELFDIEFRLRSSTQPDFQLVLQGEPKERVSVETWDDELVLTGADTFKDLEKITGDEREVGLHVFWDRKAGKCSVYTLGGELIAEWQVPENTSMTPVDIGQQFNGMGRMIFRSGRDNSLNTLHPSDLVLRNKGRDLSIEFLRVRAWDGKPPPKIDLKHPRVELGDGTVVPGEVRSGSAGTLKLRSDNGDAAPGLPLKKVDAVVFSNDAPQISGSEATLSFADGTLVMGRIASIKDGWAALETSFTEKPLGSSLDALRELRIRAPGQAGAAQEPPFAELDTITVGGTTLHGKVVGAGDGSPRWLPVGGLTPAIPSKETDSEIIRALPVNAVLPNTPALFYTSAGDVLSGSLQAIDRTGVEFESGLVEAKKLPAASLEAVQFHTVSRLNPLNFSDPGWRIVKGDEKTVQRTKDSLHMDAGTAIGHPQAMQSSEIKFKFSAGNFSIIRLRMFCAGTDDDKRSTNLILASMGERFCSGIESTEGQLESQVQTRITPGDVVVRLVIEEQDLTLYLNGIQTETFPVPPEKRAGAGLIIEPATLWGNSVNPATLSEFSAPSVPGGASLPFISADAKAEALTVPRFRKDDPPFHALLAANGDVLRGEIEAVTATHLAFRSGLETLTVPLDRVRAAIWLKKASEAAPPPPEKSAAQKRLEQRIDRRIRFGGATLVNLVQFLNSLAPDLKITPPAKEDNRRLPMSFGGQTIAEALAEICRTFGLSYRLNSDGAVLLETAAEVPKGLVRKVYWLKEGGFPAGGPSAQEILAAKGISFPDGASALWQPKGPQLTMTNTVENQGKLARTIETDFGGSLGSPTHWLLLTNGARLGLAVDKFDKDSISGHHPVYGRCTVPLSDVYVIRTSPPEPSAPMKALEDWHLVFAPEPVLPETGGESSALLGKDAKTFNLPLLSGSSFDLSQEKGKIIVLDFWATWCGPCVRSLPGLIDAMAALPADRVKLIGVNQGEPADQVMRFLETRGWKLTVAMDAAQTVGRQYGADAIPHTVIVGPDGKVAWVKTGFSPGGETEAADAVKKLLAAPQPSP